MAALKGIEPDTVQLLANDAGDTVIKMPDGYDGSQDAAFAWAIKTTLNELLPDTMEALARQGRLDATSIGDRWKAEPGDNHLIINPFEIEDAADPDDTVAGFLASLPAVQSLANKLLADHWAGAGNTDYGPLKVTDDSDSESPAPLAKLNGTAATVAIRALHHRGLAMSVLAS